MTTTKTLQDVRVGDRIVAMGSKRFTDALTVESVDRHKGEVVNVILNGGRFWPISSGDAAVTTIEVESVEVESA